MKKFYEKAELKVLVFLEEDVIRTSPTDNDVPMPDFPEDIG
jgi:hypothetical protein